MAHKIKNPRELLESSFGDLEWDYLTHHVGFKTELKKGCKTIDDYERLATFGDKLITSRQLEHPNAPPLPRPRLGKRK